MTMYRIDNDHVCSVEYKLPRNSFLYRIANSRESIIPLNTSGDCLYDLDHDHIHKQFFLPIYFWEVFFIICFLSINTGIEFIELISMLYISD